VPTARQTGCSARRVVDRRLQRSAKLRFHEIPPQFSRQLAARQGRFVELLGVERRIANRIVKDSFDDSRRIERQKLAVVTMGRP